MYLVFNFCFLYSCSCRKYEAGLETNHDSQTLQEAINSSVPLWKSKLGYVYLPPFSMKIVIITELFSIFSLTFCFARRHSNFGVNLSYRNLSQKISLFWKCACWRKVVTFLPLVNEKPRLKMFLSILRTVKRNCVVHLWPLH